MREGKGEVSPSRVGWLGLICRMHRKQRWGGGASRSSVLSSTSVSHFLWKLLCRGFYIKPVKSLAGPETL